MKRKNIEAIVGLLIDNKSIREIEMVKKTILGLMKEDDVFISEKSELVIEKKSGKLIIKSLII